MESSNPTKEVIQTRTDENIPLHIEEYTENKITQPKKRGERKLHISKFLLTVNPNVVYRDIDQANRIANCLKRGISMSIKGHLQEVIKILPRAKEQGINAQTIKSIDVQANGEIGPKNHRIHSHALVTIKHYTLLQINTSAVRQFLLEYCKDQEIKNLFVSVRFVPVSDFAEMYLDKGTSLSSTSGTTDMKSIKQKS